MIFCMRADSENVYIGFYEDGFEVEAKSWVAGRELSTQILSVIHTYCDKIAISIQDITGLVVYQGPGSYTGLRISCSVANSIGYSYSIPVVGSTGETWIEDGLKTIQETKKFVPIAPIYGGEVHITTPKK